MRVGRMMHCWTPATNVVVVVVAVVVVVLVLVVLILVFIGLLVVIGCSKY